MKRGLISLSLAILIVLVIGCDNEAEKGNKLEAYIPDNAQTVVKISNLNAVRSAAAQNELLQQNLSTTDLSWLSEMMIPDSLFSPVHPSYLATSSGKDARQSFTWIAKKDSTFTILDSLIGRIPAEVTKEISVDSTTLYVHRSDSLYLISNDSVQISHILSQPVPVGFFQRDLALGKDKELILNKLNPSLKLNDSLNVDLADESAIQLNISAAEIKASGVLLKNDSSESFVEIFRGQVPQVSTIHQVLPVDAEHLNSFSYSDLNLLQQGLQRYRKESTEIDLPIFFDGINQVSEVFMGSDHILIMSSIDGFLTEEQLAGYLTETDPFRNVPLYTMDDSELFTELFQPLITNCKPVLAFRVDNFFFFAENRQTAENVITSVSNGNTLGNAPFFQNIQSDLSNSVTFEQYFLKGNLNMGLANLFSEEKKTLKNARNYPIAAIQLSNDRNFAHFNFITREINDSKQISRGIAQRFSSSFENDIFVGPFLFNNHRSGGKDIVFQDLSNKLQLISSNGKALWTKDLKEPIVGEIHEVDILRNGKKQLAFTTARRLFVVDRNGNDVRPFPVKFDSDITQPLAIFDYDNNRKYRFAVVQGKRIRLYDSKAKVVSGFTFSQAGSEIVHPAVHLRIGNKDYVVVAEQNGRLNILNRTGKTRVTVTREFDFSEIPVKKEGSDFVVIGADNTKYKIDGNGKVTSQKLEVSNAYWFDVEGRTKVTLDDNLLRINGKLVELPYGIYNKPGIFRIRGENYVVVSETQDSKIYLYKGDATLYPGFPVFGNAETELGYDSKIGLQLVARGGQKEVVLYEIR